MDETGKVYFFSLWFLQTPAIIMDARKWRELFGQAPNT